MRNIRMIALLLCLAAVVPVAAQTVQYRHYERGGYASVELSSGMVFRQGRLTEPDYGIKMAGGYRFFPQLAVAAGFEGVNSVGTGTTCVPVFLQFRTDILDRWISPLLQLETGWAFQVKRGTYDDSVVRQSGDVQFIDVRYWDKRQFSKRGPFINLTLGASFHLRREGTANVFLGFTGGCSSYCEGLWIRRDGRGDLLFSTLETLPGGIPAVTLGDSRKMSGTVLPELRFKVGISF